MANHELAMIQDMYNNWSNRDSEQTQQNSVQEVEHVTAAIQNAFDSYGDLIEVQYPENPFNEVGASENQIVHIQDLVNKG